MPYYSKALDNTEMRTKPFIGARYYFGMGLYGAFKTVEFGVGVVNMLSNYLKQQNLYKEDKKPK